jgi:hypothetical protein
MLPAIATLWPNDENVPFSKSIEATGPARISWLPNTEPPVIASADPPVMASTEPPVIASADPPVMASTETPVIASADPLPIRQ